MCSVNQKASIFQRAIQPAPQEKMPGEMILSLSSFSLVFIGLQLYAGNCGADDGSSITTTDTNSDLSRFDFPPGFVFGAGTSAYQVEGAAAEDGRKPSIWDTFSRGAGNVASDQYHKYKDDVKLMHEMGLDAYRFSISWSRLIPDGSGAVNHKGLNYYNNLINELLRYGIEAHVTLNHFDMPQALEDKYEGPLSSKFIEDFTAYADVCFKAYGNRVKFWSTFNEPNVLSLMGYDVGLFPPGRCSYPFGVNCSRGDSTTELYLAAHNILLSHAAVVRLYRTKYQEKQKGQIGMTILGIWFEPMTNSSLDIIATKRAIDFNLGWFLSPLVNGKYSAIMKKNVGTRLPEFTANDSKLLKGSFDFIGLNYYSITKVVGIPRTSDKHASDYYGDVSAKLIWTGITDGGVKAGLGIQKLLEHVKLKYKNPPILIHENGYPMTGDGLSNSTSGSDTKQIEYIKSILRNLLPPLRNGSDLRGYFVWSLVDCFEPVVGYSTQYGLYEVDFHDKDRSRYPRRSAHWYSIFLRKTVREKETSMLFAE